MRRVLILSDSHCGHRVGLCPPKFQNMYPDKRYNDIQKELWDAYVKMIAPLKPIDTLIINGDCIDGDGRRSGGTELITTDRNVQVDMFIEAISIIGSKKIIMTYGTPYHTGENEDFELQIAKLIDADRIGSHEWIDINGLVFDIKHFVSNSTIPYSKGTSILKDRLWNVIWNEMEESQPKADVIVRSHLHSFIYVGGSNYLCIVTPALQGAGSKFGARKCSQTVDYGIVWFEIESKTEWNWSYDVRVINAQKIEPYKV